jgi:hypothetical protein
MALTTSVLPSALIATLVPNWSSESAFDAFRYACCAHPSPLRV